MSGASISLPSNTVEAVAAFLHEKLMGAPAESGNIHFAGVILSVLDVTYELDYTRAFMTGAQAAGSGQVQRLRRPIRFDHCGHDRLYLRLPVLPAFLAHC